MPEHARSVEMLLALDEREDLSPEEEALAGILTLIIEDYETRHHPFTSVYPHRVPACLDGRTRPPAQRHLARPRKQGVATEVLSGRRSISKAQGKPLADFLRVPVDLFL